VFASLFQNAELHEKIIRAIAKKRNGISRSELIRALKTTSGGRLAQRLRELEEAGFIATAIPYGYKKKNAVYRLIDEYAGFYLKWIETSPQKVFREGNREYWQAKANTAGYRSWAGYAFEGICLKHAQQIRNALGIASLAVETGTWRYIPKSNSPRERGAQIDLLFDRSDGIVTLCEIKYSNNRFVVDKAYARELKNKISIFEKQTNTPKKVFLALITTHGLRKNTWSEDLIDNAITAKDLFTS
jgi:hypothetical protein